MGRRLFKEPTNHRATTKNRTQIAQIKQIYTEKTQERNVKIVESVEKYNYSQKEVSDYLGMHYSTISRLLKKNQLLKT
ncbi:MAG TPA: hypothetical protein ACFYEL_08685 [Candidatus Wunengus californicus]|uniref:hypothetical protein n=1 Tax=Candidatus Wunengus californicus TaxID=3367619 RepID=UPI0040289D43